jgi:RNA polymerase sigma factor for flagellar operon FliA
VERLTEEELQALWSLYVDEKDQVALEALVIHYEPLARYLARRALAKAPPHQAAEDLLSYAHRGLLDAITKFEPGRNLKFETYASRRIGGEIIDGLRRQDPLTRPVRQRVKQLKEGQHSLWESLGRTPTVDELAEFMGVTVDEVRSLQVAQQTLTRELDDTVAEQLRTDDFEVAVECGSLEEAAISLLAQRIPELSDRDRLFILLYYDENLSLTAIGAQMGVNDSRASQIRREMIRALVV